MLLEEDGRQGLRLSQAVAARRRRPGGPLPLPPPPPSSAASNPSTGASAETSSSVATAVASVSRAEPEAISAQKKKATRPAGTARAPDPTCSARTGRGLRPASVPGANVTIATASRPRRPPSATAMHRAIRLTGAASAASPAPPSPSKTMPGPAARRRQCTVCPEASVTDETERRRVAGSSAKLARATGVASACVAPCTAAQRQNACGSSPAP